MMAFMRTLLLMLALVVTTLPAHAQTFPALSGRVVDTANIIPDTDEAALDAKLKALEETTDRQLVVATIPDLGGYAIDDYGYRLGRNWGLGQKDKDNGAILLIALNDRKMRIEVGYGLEPILTDGLSSVIINTQIVPQFKAGNFAGGINAGVDAMITQLKLPPEEAAKRAKQVSAKQSKEGDASAVMFWLFIFFFFILPMLWPLIFGRGKRGRRFGSGPVIIWGGGNDWGGGSGGGWGGGGFGGGGGFSGGGGSFGGGGASGGW